MTILPLQVPPPFFSIPIRTVGVLLGMLWLGCAASRPTTPAAVAAPVPPVAEPAVKAKAPTLQVGVPIERDLAPGGKGEVSLDLKAGFYLRLALYGKGAELSSSLISPEGAVLAVDDGEEDGRLAYITKIGGVYRIAVTAPKAKVAIQYQLRLTALRPAHPDDDKRLAAEAVLAAARQEKDPLRAAQQAQESLRMWQDILDHDGEFEALEAIAARDERDSVSSYGKALRQAQETGSLYNQMKAEIALGESLSRLSRVNEARPHLEAAFLGWKRLGDSYQQARALYYLGFGSYFSAKYDEAIRLYREALQVSHPGWDLTPDLWNALGLVYVSRGESHEALGCFEKALEFAKGADRKGATAAALANLGSLHWRRGEPRLALDELEESIRINQSDPNLKSDLPKVQLRLGTTYISLGQPREALANFQDAFEAFRRTGDNGWTSSALVSIGRANLMMDQPAKALENFQDALKLARGTKSPKQTGIALQWIGIAQLQLLQIPQAIQSLKEALQVQADVDRLGQALTEQKLGEAYNGEGDLVAAEEHLAKALKVTEEVEAPYFQPPILLDLARLERQKGNLQAALAHIETGIKILETVRSDLTNDRLRTSFFASRRAYYDFYVELLMELDHQRPGQGYPDKAFAASEQGRARSLLDLLAKGRSDLTRGISADLLRREREVDARLSQIRQDLVDAHADPRKTGLTGSLEEQLKTFTEQQREVEARIKTESPHYAELRYPSPLRREEIQKLLQPDEALLEYSLGEKRLYLFVVTTQGLSVHPLKPSPEKVGEDVEVLREALENGGRLTNAYLRTAHRMYRELVEPAQAEIRDKRRLLIAPDGALYHVAFEALLTREAQREQDCHFLIEDRAVSYVPSASVLSTLEAPVAGAGPRKRLIAFAPAYSHPGDLQPATRSASGDPSLPDLEGARQEVAAIVGLYPETERAVYVGPEASRESFRHSPRAVFLHFAGHGRLDEEHPERSSLEFTDGSLQVDDIFNLELSSDLVVLSACRTAGKVVTGEGLVGLTRAFLYAGTPSVMVTLWQAVDTSARDLMVQLYTNLSRQGDKAEALRQAKLALIARGRRTGGRLARPYYWAPFILVGKPR